jgi:hypothetical protein
MIIIELEKLQNLITTLYENTFTGTAVIANSVIKKTVDATLIFVLKSVFGLIDKTKKPEFDVVLRKLLTDNANELLQNMLKHTELDIKQIVKKYLSDNYKKIITLLEEKKNEGLLKSMVTATESLLRVTNIDVLKADIMIALQFAYQDLKKISGYKQIQIGAEQINRESDLIIKKYINDVSNKIKILYMLLAMLATSSGYLLWELKYIYNTRKDLNAKIEEYEYAYKNYSQQQDGYYEPPGSNQGTRKGSKNKTKPINPDKLTHLKAYVDDVSDDDKQPQPQPQPTTRSSKQGKETGIKQLTYIQKKGGNKKSRKNKTKKNKRKNRKNKTYKK